MPGPGPTHIERVVRHIHHMALWRKALLTLALLGLPYALTTIEGVRALYMNREMWRVAYFPTVTVLYIVAVAPWIWHAEQRVIQGLGPLLPAGCDSFEPLAQQSWWRSSLGEWSAFGAGLLGGILLLVSTPLPDLRHWSAHYWMGTTIAMYGSLAWLIYAALGSARLTALLHRHVQHTDPFDLSPFEPVGRQGLILAMIFIGAITLSLLLIYTPTMFLEWQGILIYSILVLVTILIFLTVMWPAHQVLRRGKDQALAGVERLIGHCFRNLEMLAADGADTRTVATEVQAWIMLEQRLKHTRTWPYDTEMLRTLFLSILTPLFVAIARVVGIYLTEGHF